MEAVEAKDVALKLKLVQLHINTERTNNALESSKEDIIVRQLETLKALLSEVGYLRRAEEALKISAKESIEEITEWNAGIDAKLEKTDGEVNRLREWLDNSKRKSEMVVREEQMRHEVKLHEAKLKLQADQQQQNQQTVGMAKLPKLIISKFKGQFMDWPRFWAQYTETIDKSVISPTTKFAYLRELLEEKVKKNIEALPHTAEGYNRAKTILEEKYGKESEIVKSYVREILDLPTITTTNPRKIKEFSEKLNYCVQSLQTMKKLQEIKGNVAMTLDKLPAIRGDLVRTDPEWESWDFAKLSEALRLWIRRNPCDEKEDQEKPSRKREQLFQARKDNYRPRGCVYCTDSSHKATECQKITDISERKKILMKHRLCFNCAMGNHRAAECPSKTSCQLCHKRHHTSICNSQATADAVESKVAMTASGSGEGVFPIVVVRVNGVKCRALIDSGAGSSYISSKLIQIIQAKPVEVQMKQIDMLMCSKQARLETYQLKLESLDTKCEMEVQFIKVDKAELLSVDNPQYEMLVKNHPHLQGITIADDGTKPQFPVHVVLGSGEYARIKTNTKPRVGKEHEPIAELTKMGWFVMSPRNEYDRELMMMIQTTQTDYEHLCRLDVLGLADKPEHDQTMVYSEFKEQLVRSPEGWYETGLPWRGNHPQLPTNKAGSLQRLNSLTRRLQRKGQAVEYDSIIREQLQDGVVEVAPETPTAKEFYIPHKAVVRETAQSTKMRVVYDASAKANPESPSLNDCLYAGPPLQNRLWDVLVRQRAYPVVVVGDIQKAFLQIRIRKCERDALRFHWRKDEHSNVETLRFTRALFGLAPSPFLLGGVLEAHLDKWEEHQPEVVAELRRSLYVDDLLTGGQTETKAQLRKATAIKILSDATFQLHKWASNVPALEDDKQVESSEEQSFAKEQLSVQPSETKMLGLRWDKQQDTLAVVFPEEETSPTKRGILSKLAKVYDPLGLVSPLMLEGKLIYRRVCESKTPWDTQLQPSHLRQWRKWEQSLPLEQQIPRPIVQHREPVVELELHAFGDASREGVGAAVYTVVRQQSGTTQRLVTAKSRLAKQGLTIPRLELISAHMATNLVINVLNALDNLPTPKVYAWLDSTVALYWINSGGRYKQFVQNRVAKIQAYQNIKWRYVPTSENPADLASRGGAAQNPVSWYVGPEWLQDPRRWPDNPVAQATTASEVEAKMIREVMCVTHAEISHDAFDDLIERGSLHKTLRVGAWIRRFVDNARKPTKRSGPLTTEEIQAQHLFWVKRAQANAKNEDDQLRLNLQEDEQHVLKCHGRLQGEYPVYLPDDHSYTRKLVHQAHLATLHGGATLTMAHVRTKHWVPRLRRLTKQVIRKCSGCKRFQVRAVEQPPPGNLPKDRTEGSAPFQVVGVDYAGPIKYKVRKNQDGKAYIVLYACSLTRALYLELAKSMDTTEFLGSLKRLVARRGRPEKIYSDNAKTFIAAAKWVKQVMKDEKMQDYLANQNIVWQFNLSRAPWWGGQFERMVGLVKRSLYKTIGNGRLTWDELREVLLDVEVTLNNRPLSYIEDDIQLPILTPNSMLHPQSSVIPELQPHHIGDKNLRKREKYLRKVKDSMWSRWTNEYLRGLRERHDLHHKGQVLSVKVGDVVIIKAEERNRGKWPLGVITKLYEGRDGVVRGVRMRAGKGFLERPIQYIYPLELSCDRAATKPVLNPAAPTFNPRPRRDAAVAADVRIREIAEEEQ